MLARDMLDMTCGQWIDSFRLEFPFLMELLRQNNDAKSFEESLTDWVHTYLKNSDLTLSQRQAADSLLQLMAQSDSLCLECSEESVISCCSLRTFWHAMREDPFSVNPDFYHEFYRLFAQLKYGNSTEFPSSDCSLWMSRWAAATDPDVHQVQTDNKRRIMRELVKDIAQLSEKPYPGRFFFEPTMSEKQRCFLVEEWWNDHRFHLSMAVRDPDRLNRYLNYTLPTEVMTRLHKAQQKGIPFFVTPYYLSLLDTTGSVYDDYTLRDYILYSDELIENFGHIKAWEREDVVNPEEGNVAGWLLPDSHSVHRRYPEVAILIPDTMGRACGGLCASCQRMYGFQKGHLNFDLDELKPKRGWLENLGDCLSYFENDSQIRDILITGGDALMSQNKTLRIIFDEIYKMAVRKHDMNRYRPLGSKYAEIQRVRIGTRLPVYLPFRMNPELIQILREFRIKATQAGISQFIIQTHFQSPLELTEDALEGIRRLLSAGWCVTNQLVFTVPASRRGHTARLRQLLNQAGVICYYTFTVKGFDENKHLFVPNARSVQEQEEEKKYGLIPDSLLAPLMELLDDPSQYGDLIPSFLEENNMPFLATDRSVMNLPGIGKSMSYRLASIDSQGRRILAFSHDSTRKHSPRIESYPEIYIRERKSVAAYLRQLRNLGEDIDSYSSIWSYRRAYTEPRFCYYEYPDAIEGITHIFTNLA